MLLKRNISIFKAFLFSMVIMTALSVIIIGCFWLFDEYSEHLNESADMKTEYEETQKGMVKDEVEKVYAYVEYKKSLLKEQLKRTVKNRTQDAYAAVLNLYDLNKSTGNFEAAKKSVKDALQSFGHSDGRGRFFAINANGVNQLSAGLHGRDGSNIPGKSSFWVKNEFKEMIVIAGDSGEGFYEFHRPKTDATDRMISGIAFVKYFEPLGWFIGTAGLLDEVERDIQQEVLDHIARIRFGKDGYIFAGRWDGLILTGPAKGRNMYAITDANGLNIVHELIALSKKGGGFLRYALPGFEGRDPARKISYVKGIKDWQWYIGAGVQMDEIDRVIAAKRELLKKHVNIQSLKITFTLLALLILIIIISNYISGKAKKNFKLFSSFFEKAAIAAENIDLKSVYFSEFSKLANAANRMLNDRRHAEEELQKKEAHQALVLGTLPMVFYRRLPAGSYSFTWVSEQIHQISGFAPENFLNDHELWASRLHPDDRERVPNQLRNLNQKETTEVDYRWQTAGGAYLWIRDHSVIRRDNSGAPVEVIGAWRDITKHKSSEASLKQSEATLNSIFSAAPIGIGLTSNWRIKKVNNQICSMLGYTEDELLNRNYGIVFPLRQELRRIAGKACEQTQTEEPITVETRLKCKNGSLVDVLLCSTPIDPSNPSAGVVFTVMDITDRKKAEAERHNLEALLQQAQKMEAIGTLAGGIAHDFNNILSPILIHAELAQLDLPPHSSVHQNLDEILKAGKRAKSLVLQILAFSRQGKQERILLKIGTVIAEALKLLRALLPTTIEIDQDINGVESDTVLADPTQIHQILMNLSTNAAHAMRENGGILKVTLSEEHLDSASESASPYLKPGAYLRLTVSDTGCGMDQELIKKIFVPYFTTKEPGEGTGLGLAVVHGIVKSYGGAIRVDSEPGRGTEFVIYLPRVESGGVLKTDHSRLLPGGNESVLLVDDEKEMIDAVQAMLERLGYRVTARTSSIEALEVFRSKPGEFDLVITDQTMPNMTGENLAKELLALSPEIPIVLCTGFSESFNEWKAKSLGVRAYLMKPILMNEMATVIRNVLEKG